MKLDVLIAAAMLLSLERLCYIWVWRSAAAFRALCAGSSSFPAEPTDALRALFVGFKALQITVFAWWCFAHADGPVWPPDGPVWALAIGTALIAVGQSLNLGVFYRLGSASQSSWGNRRMRSAPQIVSTVPTYCGCAVSENGNASHHSTL